MNTASQLCCIVLPSIVSDTWVPVQDTKQYECIRGSLYTQHSVSAAWENTLSFIVLLLGKMPACALKLISFCITHDWWVSPHSKTCLSEKCRVHSVVKAQGFNLGLDFCWARQNVELHTGSRLIYHLGLFSKSEVDEKCVQLVDRLLDIFPFFVLPKCVIHFLQVAAAVGTQ